MKTWKEALKEADSNNDGKLSFLEFQDAVKLAEKKMREKQEAWFISQLSSSPFRSIFSVKTSQYKLVIERVISKECYYHSWAAMKCN